MGIIYAHAAALLRARHNHICFDKILTIGHQTLFLSQKQIKRLATLYGLEVDASAFSQQQYADKFFKVFLDAKEMMSLDYSEYENCDIIHDMNHPVDQKYHDNFDVVIDGGSLEHIFNFPVAVANCMNMVRKGGSFFMFTPANNYLGHGFYQFSPELIFRIFQPKNGFEIVEVILTKHPFPGAELSPAVKCFSVADPDVLKERIGLVSKTPVLMMVHAVRNEIKPIFFDYPVQSDYIAKYNNKNNATPAQHGNTYNSQLNKKVTNTVYSLLPLRFKNFIIGQRQLFRYSLSNRRFYRRWHS